MGAITVKNLGKAYRQYPTRWSRLIEWFDPRDKPRHKQHWVLQNISFSVSPGEAVGIIGINGAGKSTLLKMITGTTQPTTGDVTLTGSVAALLELGMGFHPDFTGRQNVYMASQLLGISNSEIAEKMAEIEEFAEIGDYINQPVRTYSSGMQVRLAFSVATSVRPDILIVDEALSVGDAYFQHKSFDRIRQFRDQGTTLLFVSHSPDAIKSLCNRAILIDGGIVLRNDSPDVVLDYYNAAIAKQRADYDIKQTEQLTGQKMTRSGSGDATIEIVELYVNDEPVRALLSGAEATLRICGKTIVEIEELTVGILIRDRLGNDVFGTNTYHHTLSQKNLASEAFFIVDFKFPALNLGIGSYSLTVALHSRDAHVTDNYDWWDRVLVFQVLPGNTPPSIGVSNFPLSIHWQETTVNKNRKKVEKEIKQEEIINFGDEEKLPGITISILEPLAEMTVGEYYIISILLQNYSGQLLSSSIAEPFNLSYHWIDESNGDCLVFDGIRTPLPSPCLPYAELENCKVRIKAPENIGNYRLDIALVHEGVCWHESKEQATLHVNIIQKSNQSPVNTNND